MFKLYRWEGKVCFHQRNLVQTDLTRVFEIFSNGFRGSNSTFDFLSTWLLTSDFIYIWLLTSELVIFWLSSSKLYFTIDLMSYIFGVCHIEKKIIEDNVYEESKLSCVLISSMKYFESDYCPLTYDVRPWYLKIVVFWHV